MEAEWNCSSRCDSELCLSHSRIHRQESMEVLQRLCSLSRVIICVKYSPCYPPQARVWTLCLGSTMVFGPILGKTWRLYRVFTQRVPDKRVIIRDIQLMAMVALLILVDLLVLSAWNLSDPIRCSRSLGAVVKVSLTHIVAGAIFICTLATNCMLFVPQLTEWRHFEEDHPNPSQMAKYFSSPSKSQPTVYSQEDIYFLLGENNSMKKLLSEKNAVIDSLQEQVSNAKDKLLRLVSASQTSEEQEADNFQSSSTQTTELQSCRLSASLPHGDVKSRLSPPPSVSPRLVAVPSSSSCPGSYDHSPLPSSVTPTAAPSPLSGGLDADPCESRAEDPLQSSGFHRTAEEKAKFVTFPQSPRLLNPFEVETLTSGPTSPLGPNTRPAGFVSSEKLQEILQELSVDTVLASVLKSARVPSHSRFTEDSSLSPISMRTPRSPNSPVVFRYPSISPYAMRKRRPPFHSPRRGLTPPCLHAERRIKDGCQNRKKHPEGITINGGVSVDGSILQVPNCDFNLKDEEVGSMASRSHECSPELVDTSDMEMGCDSQELSKELARRNSGDPHGYWDSDSSSSTEYCFYHRPYCDSCLQRGSLLSSDSSDSEYEGYQLCRSAHPVVFKEDLKPTFV
uniref:G protein-coupled receptor 156 n=1 Tax=Hippocampus comes TaxID=109280 RepID=A0A3Q3DSY5_HIPCM